MYSVYNLGTGEILWTGACGIPNVPAGCGIIYDRAVCGATHYVCDMAISHRPAQETALTGQTITGFPEGATLVVKGQEYDLTGETEVILDFDLPGDYPITITYWPYLDWRGEIHVP